MKDELDGMDTTVIGTRRSTILERMVLPDSLEVSCDAKSIIQLPILIRRMIITTGSPLTNVIRMQTAITSARATRISIRRTTGFRIMANRTSTKTTEQCQTRILELRRLTHLNSYFGCRHVPMGAKIWQKSYAWAAGTSADAIVFMDYSFVDIGLERGRMRMWPCLPTWTSVR